MGQVPETKSNSYLIVGDGKLARHITHYFNLLKIPNSNWSRKSVNTFESAAVNAGGIIVLIPDNAIEEFITSHAFIKNKTWIHCSGALSTQLAESAHPLMTFTDTLYDINTYKEIVFVTEKGRADFNDLFPDLPNLHYHIPAEVKGYYHAWCSMAGNFTSLLWMEFYNRLKTEFKIDKEAAFPYLKAIANNLMQETNPLTGPFTRGDNSTIQKHLNSLRDDNYGEVYKAFLSAFKKDNANKDLI